MIFPPNTELEGIDDSKALDEAQRRRLDLEIRQRAAAVGIGVVDVEEIDRLDKGDGINFSIASASIAAKVHRLWKRISG